jgi:selenoprotein W-related protein
MRHQRLIESSEARNNDREKAMKKVSITYCKPCGYERHATDAAAALQKELALAATLVPGTGGIFEVRVGDEVVAKRAKSHFPDTAEIVAAVSAAVKAG